MPGQPSTAVIRNDPSGGADDVTEPPSGSRAPVGQNVTMKGLAFPPPTGRREHSGATAPDSHRLPAMSRRQADRSVRHRPRATTRRRGRTVYGHAPRTPESAGARDRQWEKPGGIR